MMSSDKRRIKVRASASFDGSMFFSTSFSAMKASIGFLMLNFELLMAGVGGFTSGV